MNTVWEIGHSLTDINAFRNAFFATLEHRVDGESFLEDNSIYICWYVAKIKTKRKNVLGYISTSRNN